MNNNLYPSEIKVYPEMLILSGSMPCDAIKHIVKTNQMFIGHQCQKQCHEITKLLWSNNIQSSPCRESEIKAEQQKDKGLDTCMKR